MVNIDIQQFFIEFFATKGVDKLFDSIQKYLAKKNKEPVFDQSYFAESLKQNITKTINWSTNITYSISEEDILTEDVYVDLDYYDYYPRESYKEIKQPKQSLVKDVFSQTSKHLIILGEGGSGKTTSMQMICRKLLSDESFLPNHQFPLVLRFREHNEKFSDLNKHITEDNDIPYQTYRGNLLFWTLYKELGLPFKNKNDSNNSIRYHLEIENGFLQKYVIEVLNLLRPVIILDGFDEINHNLKSKILNEINELCLSLTDARLVITSRTGEFEHSIPNAKKFKLAPFDDKKILSFCQAWFKDEQKGIKLYEEIRKTPFYDTTIRPINLTHLAILYNANGYLPPKPKAVYNQIINLHITRWDNIIRYFNRESNISISAVSKFDSSIKYDFLTHLAFYLSAENLILFDKMRLANIYKTKLVPEFKVKPEQFNEVLNEIESHTGLFIQSGPEKFEFPHKSIHEFLTAEYISKYQPLDQIKNIVFNLPNELAIATCLTTNPNYFFSQAVQLFLLDRQKSESNFLLYLNRLITENPDFKISVDLGYDTLVMREKLRSFKNFHDSFIKFYSLEGIKESIKSLEGLYRFDADFYPELAKMDKETIRQHKFSLEVKIKLREALKLSDKFALSFTLPIFLVSDWKYVRKYTE